MAEQAQQRTVPPGFVLHTESTTSILFAIPAPAISTKNARSATEATAPVFLNPVQEYNRDLSIVAIRTWSELRQEEKCAGWREVQAKKAARRKRPREETMGNEEGKKNKVEGESSVEVVGESVEPVADTVVPADVPVASEPTMAIDTAAPVEAAPVVSEAFAPIYTFTILEALSATGLRAIRYAKEIPLLRYVIANDLEPSAVESIRKNVEWNNLGPTSTASAEPSTSATPTSYMEREAIKSAQDMVKLGKVRPNQGDACGVMYNHRSPETRFDCVDLDPYGSAVPFLDAAIGSVADGGLLCITCTDLAVLAGHNYPEKCFSHYGGSSVNAEYSHEVALRLVLSAIATTAGRYGRHIVPLVSLSIDFYVRVFVRVYTSPKEVKNLASNISTLLYCHDCQSPHLQTMGRVSTSVSAKNQQTNYKYHNAHGPPAGVGEKCEECGGKFKIGGPLWSGPLHSNEFVGKMLEHVRSSPESYGTSTRIEGMLAVAQSELEAPFYFTPSRICGFFHCTAPPITTVASGLLNAGYEVSRSHASAGSIKTNAPRHVVYDVIRAWIKDHPVEMKNIKTGSPALKLLSKENPVEIDLKWNPKAEDALQSKLKLVRYQQNPTENWGPGRAAVRSGKH